MLAVYSDLVDSLITDVASESHRAVRLGVEGVPSNRVTNAAGTEQRGAQAVEQPQGGGHGSSVPLDTESSQQKCTVDIFGQTHPPVATQKFECLNCSRPIGAGRYAPHLEKCMGKVRSQLSTSAECRMLSAEWCF